MLGGWDQAMAPSTQCPFWASYRTLDTIYFDGCGIAPLERFAMLYIMLPICAVSIDSAFNVLD